jgi:hypothetical protein
MPTVCGRTARLGLHHGFGCIVTVAIEAAARLAAEEAGVHQFLLQHRRRKALVAEIGRVHRLRDREIHVVADQVHQLEGTHAESPAVAHHGVQRRRIGGAFLQQAQRLGIVWAGDAVDDEARGRRRVHGVLAPGLRGGVDGVGNVLVSRQAADHFDQRHQRHGIKEVHADQAFGMAQWRRDRGDGNRGSVGREDAARVDDGFKVGEQGALDVEVFDDGFHHQRRIFYLVQRVHGAQAFACEIRLGGAHAALLDQPGVDLADVRDGLACGFRTRVEQAYLVAAGRCHLRDAGTHGAAADDGNDAALCQCRHPYSPLNCAGRLAMKAATPSR